MRGEPIEQQSIRGIAERYDSRVAANGGDRERITYAIVDYHRAVDDVSAGNRPCLLARPFQSYPFGIPSLRVHDPWRPILFSFQLCRVPLQCFSGG